MKIVITGANGFIGSNLIKCLLQKEHEIFAISRKNYNIKYLNVIFKQIENENIEILSRDIVQFNPDVVIHCAWDGGNSFSNVNDTVQFNNIIWSYKLLEIITKLKNPHFICIGSASEYGDTKNVNIDENYSENPINLYGISKFSFKVLSEHFCKINNIPWSWIRPFYTYGPNDVSTRLIPKIINKCFSQLDIELNSCESVVDYLYIEDFVKGIESIINLRLEGIYNICSGNKYKIKDVIQQIKYLTNSNSNITFNEKLNRQQFPTHICGDNKKLLNTSNWKPEVNLAEGLLKTINYLHETLNNN
jgi:nucleoside-diphosphate-sugar epimerase